MKKIDGVFTFPLCILFFFANSAFAFDEKSYTLNEVCSVSNYSKPDLFIFHHGESPPNEISQLKVDLDFKKSDSGPDPRYWLSRLQVEFDRPFRTENFSCSRGSGSIKGSPNEFKINFSCVDRIGIQSPGHNFGKAGPVYIEEHHIDYYVIVNEAYTDVIARFKLFRRPTSLKDAITLSGDWSVYARCNAAQ